MPRVRKPQATLVQGRVQRSQPATVSALSINCGSAVGPVTATTSAGQTATLRDDGVAPDLAAGDGIRFVASNGAVFAVMVYAYILFMVFPIYNTIETLDRNQIEAARDLGASTWRIHWRVVLPHAKPGIAVGAVMTFMLSAGSIAAPEIVGRGLHPDWFSQVIYQRFFESNNWNQGSAYALVLLVACVVFVLVVMKLFRVGIRDIAK